MDTDIVEKITLDDGRLAQRRTYLDQDNNEVAEIFVEPKKDLVLQKRVITKYENVVSEQIIQTLDEKGEVVNEERKSIKPELQSAAPTGYVTKEALDTALVNLASQLQNTKKEVASFVPEVSYAAASVAPPLVASKSEEMPKISKTSMVLGGLVVVQAIFMAILYLV